MDEMMLLMPFVIMAACGILLIMSIFLTGSISEHNVSTISRIFRIAYSWAFIWSIKHEYY